MTGPFNWRDRKPDDELLLTRADLEMERAEAAQAARAEVIAERDAELLKHGQINVGTVVGYEAGIEEGRRLAFAEIRAGVEGLPLYPGETGAGITTTVSTTVKLERFKAAVLALLPPTEPKT